jgi:hypothetical protein
MNTNDATRGGSDFLSDLGQAARDNPVPAALIGMGLVWLFSGAKPLGPLTEGAAASLEAGRSTLRAGLNAASETASQAASRVGETVQGVGVQLGQTVAAASGKLRATGLAAADRSQQAAQSANGSMGGGRYGEMFADLRTNVMEAFQRQPLLLGALGIAIGAGIAASLPISVTETELLGPHADRVKDRAEDFAAQQAKRAGGLASSVASAAAEEARIQGLTIDRAKAAATDLGDKLQSVAEAAATSGRKAVH